MSGSARAIRQGFRSLRNGGTAALLGLPSKPVELDLPNDIIFKGATVLGINGRKMFETWYQVENFLLSGRLNLDPIVRQLERRAVLLNDEIRHSPERNIAKGFAPRRRGLLAREQIRNASVARRIAHAKP